MPLSRVTIAQYADLGYSSVNLNGFDVFNPTDGGNAYPTIASLARFPWEIRPWSGVTQGYYVDCWDKGFLLQTYTTTPDQYFVVLQARLGADMMALMGDLAFMASAGVLVHDEDSGGFVRHTPAGPDLYYHLGEGDKRRLIDGLRKAGWQG